MRTADSRPERIVSLIASGTEIVAALGMGERLVGRSHSCDYPEWVTNLPILTTPKLDPEAASLQIDQDVRALLEGGLGVYRIDGDQLAILRPDVVVTQDHCEVCAVSLNDVQDALSCVELPDVRICTLLPRTLSDVRADFRRVAEALAAPERGIELIRIFDERLEAVQTRVADLPVQRIAMIEWLDPPMLAGGWMPELANVVGAEAVLVKEGESRAVSWEDIARADPDRVIIIPCGFDAQRSLEEVKSPRIERGLNEIPAVKSGRCSVLAGESYFNRPGPRLVESAELLAAACHPGAFPDFEEAYQDSLYSAVGTGQQTRGNEEPSVSNDG